MGRPHRVVSQARHALSAEFAQLQPGSAVLLAVSGGADSLALAASAVYAAKDRAIQLHSLTVDHGLRENSEREAEAVVYQLNAMGINARSVRINVDGVSGPEGNARSGRYDALAREARRLWCDAGVRDEHEQAVPVLLGHNADEQAETVLLGLARGSGARSLAGMPRRGYLPEQPSVPMIRPLIDLRREELRTVCTELGLEWVEDPTNELDSEWRSANGAPLKRSAIRHILMPALEETLGKSIVQALVRTGKLLRDDDEALSTLAAQALANALVCNSDRQALAIDSRHLREYPPAVRTRALRMAALRAGARSGELFYSHIHALDKLIIENDNNLRVDLPGAYAWKQHGIVELGMGRFAPVDTR